MVNSRHAAPGGLELVRRFLNTWVIANQTREPEDRLSALAGDVQAWNVTFDAPRPRTTAERAELVQLRADLRQMLASALVNASVINGLLIETQASGYRLWAGPGRLDWESFRDLSAAATGVLSCDPARLGSSCVRPWICGGAQPSPTLLMGRQPWQPGSRPWKKAG